MYNSTVIIKNYAGIEISYQELLEMPLHLFKSLRVDTPEQESLIQEIYNKRTAHIAPETKIYTGDVPFEIKTPEEEAYWQKILDERRAKVKARSQVQHPILQEQNLQDEVVRLEKEKLELEHGLAVSDRFCQDCDAKGPIKHKKICINYK